MGVLGLFGAAGLSAAPADPPLPPGGAAILSWTPEQQAWGYRNMEKIAPVRVFKRGESVHPLPLGSLIDPTFNAGGKTYNTTTQPPNGSGQGKTALAGEETGAANLAGCLDFSRSSSPPAPQIRRPLND